MLKTQFKLSSKILLNAFEMKMCNLIILQSINLAIIKYYTNDFLLPL